MSEPLPSVATAAAPAHPTAASAGPHASHGMSYELADEAATERLGAQLAEVAVAGDVFFLRGELGAGKTSLARGFLRRYFADPYLECPSPSYLLCFEYSDRTGDTQQAADGSSARPTAMGQTHCA